MSFEIEVKTAEGEPLEFVKWYEILKDVGVFLFTFSMIVWNESKMCLTFIGDGQAFTLYVVHHEDAKFTDSTPDGVRALNALARHLKIEGKTTAEAIVQAANSGDELAIQCEKTEKGRLWTVGLTEALQD